MPLGLMVRLSDDSLAQRNTCVLAATVTSSPEPGVPEAPKASQVKGSLQQPLVTEVKDAANAPCAANNSRKENMAAVRVARLACMVMAERMVVGIWQESARKDA